jgi:hypothetical protein
MIEKLQYELWVVVVHVEDIHVVHALEGHTDAIMDMVLLLDGRLCTASHNGNMKIWDGLCR